MTATPTRWFVQCDRADLFGCETQGVRIEAGSLAGARAILRAQGWRCGPWREWSSAAHLDLCPGCVAYARRAIRELDRSAQ